MERKYKVPHISFNCPTFAFTYSSRNPQSLYEDSINYSHLCLRNLKLGECLIWDFSKNAGKIALS